MKSLLIAGIFIVSHCNVLFAFATRTICFYTVKPTENPPEIDGVLNENCWKKATVASEFYEYWKTAPGPGELKTEFRMLYGKKGIYLGITNYDEHVEKIRAVKIMRDDPKLWTDDCAEIYFDPEAKAVGYLKFTTNPLGTRHDLRRIDSANISDSWNGEGWEVKTSRGKDYWIIEVFFPWSDLGKKVTTGHIWMFDLVRYAYSTGKFRGVTWSPGGNYNSPQYFGYLYFGGKERINTDKVGELLSGKITPPWELPMEDGFLLCLEKGHISFLSTRQLLSREKETVEAWIRKTSDILDRANKNSKIKGFAGDFETAKTEFDSLDFETSSAVETRGVVRNLRKVKTQVEKLYWESMIEKLLQDI